MKKLLLSMIFVLTSIFTFSQVANYSYSATTSTWAANSSPTAITGLGSGINDVLSSAINIGFTFTYDGVVYTQFKASSNGFLTFNTANTLAQPINNLNTSTDRVILAVLWDDDQTGASGNVNYKLTGTSPNQVLTIEWLALRWNKNGFSAGTIDCQIKLYQNTNVIEYIYNRGSYQSFGNSTSIGASIGLGGATSGDFLSLSDLKASPIKSTSVETTTIGASPTNLTSLTSGQANTQIPNGTKYIFTPPPTITTSGSTTAFTSCSGSVSSEQSYSVSGFGLSANITVTAPSGFEISTTSGSGFTSPLTLTQSGGVVSSTTIYIRMTSSASGTPSGNITNASTSATTKNIAVSGTVTTSVTPSVSISGTSSICSGTSVTFTATPTNGGASPSYQWKLNGGNVGTNSTTYTNSGLANSDIVSAVMTANNTCQTSSTATSNSINMTVTSNVTPSVSIAGTSSICSGTSVTFTATPTNGGASPSYQWKLNGVNGGTNSTTYTNAGLTNGDVVSAVMTANNTCQTSSTGTSNSITMVVSQPSVGGSVASNQNVVSGGNATTVNLTGHTGSVVKWEKSTVSDFSTSTDIANTTTSLSGSSMGSITQTVHYRAVVQNGTCATANSAYVKITVVSSLPIELLYFSGVVCETGNRLYWSTASESNNDYFNIEKTKDGNIWKSIEIIDGAGNSSNQLYYSFVDEDVESIINYYRLKQTDYDGKFKYSDIISIDNTNKSKDIDRITNILGQEINLEYHRGLVIIYYTDGSYQKMIK
jgi:hypothetical protein